MSSNTTNTAPLPLKLKAPLAFFDLETTGTNVIHDRIVEIAVIKLTPTGEQQTWTKRVHPEKPIPAEASAVHGIYDADIQDAPPFKAIAKELANFLQGCDLAGFNVLRFDIPILQESFLRAGVDFKIAHRKVVDAQQIFHLMEKRNLAAAYRFYCNQELTNAHNALADTQATVEVLTAQVARYDSQPVTDHQGQRLGTIENDIAKLHIVSNGPNVDFAGRMVYDEQGKPIFNFGKHKGKAVWEVLKKEPSYYDWMMKGDFPLDTKRKLTQIKLQENQE
ncbi:MAG: 3'-5' exonuclease [Bacteroidota bacterium]